VFGGLGHPGVESERLGYLLAGLADGAVIVDNQRLRKLAPSIWGVWPRLRVRTTAVDALNISHLHGEKYSE